MQGCAGPQPARCCRVELCSTSYSCASPAVRPRLSNRGSPRVDRRTPLAPYRALAAATAEPENNGDGGIQARGVATPGSRDGHAEVAELQRQLDKLSALVRLQQGLLEEQQQQLSQMQKRQTLLDQQAAATAFASASTSQDLQQLFDGGINPHFSPLASGWGMVTSPQSSQGQLQAGKQRMTPFEAQRIGIGDRRLLGLYDSRFHSTAA